jgi:hypothetical protein
LEAPDKLLSWTDEEIEREIQRHLPVSCAFSCKWREGSWRARVESDDASVALEVENIDRRMAFYAVYGHLWLRNHRSEPGSQWDSTTPRPTVASVTRYVQSSIAEPEDLDPDHVASVYGLSPSQKG